mmetsp:Transcript_38598/g.38131  ORF Transcript_38598/g.38131 Transcript_38598/m.38131 type:complete len:169 (-) Transcript_38598:255-761(-)
MQVVGEVGARSTVDYKGNFFKAARVVIENEGASGLLKGIQATWMRESIYSSLRLGLYEPIKHSLGHTDKRNTPFYIKFLAGGISGMLASSVANPTDVLKIRMQAMEKDHHNVLWHIRDIMKNNGVLGFYKGLQATIVRAIMLNATKLSTYDHIKHTLINLGILEEGYL